MATRAMFRSLGAWRVWLDGRGTINIAQRSKMVEVLNALFSILFLICCGGVAVIILASVWWRENTGEGLVQVVVLGDAGRSPRMQYHCLSLVQLNYSVDLIGYGGSPLIKELRESQRLTHHLLSEPPRFINAIPRVIRYFVKVMFQTLNLLWIIFVLTKKPSHILVQTPPAIPTLSVVVLACALRGSKLIIDYHNYGHTMLALSLGYRHPIVCLAKRYEVMFSGFAYANLCVSEAMKKDLKRTLGIHAIILYDRPPGRFKPTTIEKRHNLFKRLAETEPAFKGEISSKNSESTCFTVCEENGKISLRKDRPFLIISSTSWTEDEDFGILLQALEIYEEKASQHLKNEVPKLMCIITGKGPLKEYYKKEIAKKNFHNVIICTLWLSAEDYPVLLDPDDDTNISAVVISRVHKNEEYRTVHYTNDDNRWESSADLGVCLHKSSSGLDLPMKVVDMFGCGLPVCAIHFNCLHELLRHEHNGLVFNDYRELAEQLQVLSRGFPASTPHLTRYRDNLSSFQSLRWGHYWKLHVLPLISPPQ